MYRGQFYVPFMAHSVATFSQMTSHSHALNGQTKTLHDK